MSKWIVWSKPAPLKALAVAAVLAVVISVPLFFILEWLGVGHRFAHGAAIIVGVLVGSFYTNSQRREPKNKQP